LTVAAESPLDTDVVDELEDDGLEEHAATTIGRTARPIAIANHLRRGDPEPSSDPSRVAPSPLA
jgi:hypothetical protein